MNKILRNPSGTVLFLSLPLILLILALGQYFIVTQIKKHRLIQAKAMNILCSKSILSKRKKHLDYIAKTNQAIRVAYAASFIPKTRAVALAVLKKIKAVQKIQIYSHEPSLRILKECKKSLLLSSLKSPFLARKMKIKRRKDETVRLIKRKEKIKIISRLRKASFSNIHIQYEKENLRLIKYSSF